VRELIVPPVATVAEDTNLTDPVWENADAYPDQEILSRLVGGEWQHVTAAEFRAEIVGLAKGLIAAGVGPGDRVGLMSKTRYEWTLFDYAIWSAGAVTVPIYETSSAEQVAWILGNSGAVAVVAETADHVAVVESVRSQLPDLAAVWQIDTDVVATLTDEGFGTPDEAVAERRAGVRRDDLATIIYTSGTTGRPKGCELTHGAFYADVANAMPGLSKLFKDGSSTLLFLPLAHVFARLIQCGAIATRTRLGHSADVKNLLADLAVFKPTFILAVPRVFEKVYNGAKQKAHAGGKGAIFDAAERTAIAYSEALDTGGAGLGLKLKHTLFDKLVYSKLHAALGGECIAAVSGGAPLGARLGHFFRGIGLTVYEGYGLTETSAPSTVNQPDAIKVGTVGRPLPSVGIRIASDGEVLISGPHLFSGYWQNPAATKEAIDPEGWFHTGDLGELDSDGFLKITGRKKEIIVTAGGKNVAPAVLEDTVRAHPLISQAMVVGDQQPFIACLVTIDPEAFEPWKERTGKPAGTSVADLLDDAELRAEVQGAVDQANRGVSKAEGIKKFAILPRDFTEEGGEMTPSLKLRRHVIMKQYAEDVAALYR
jgi:long-chain acyl-CoA synthetase